MAVLIPRLWASAITCRLLSQASEMGLVVVAMGWILNLASLEVCAGYAKVGHPPPAPAASPSGTTGSDGCGGAHRHQRPERQERGGDKLHGA
jgi:hypothetical protein